MADFEIGGIVLALQQVRQHWREGQQRLLEPGGRDLPSPAVVGDFLLISGMSGMLTTYDAKSGAILFTERLGSAIGAAADAVTPGTSDDE